MWWESCRFRPQTRPGVGVGVGLVHKFNLDRKSDQEADVHTEGKRALLRNIEYIVGATLCVYSFRTIGSASPVCRVTSKTQCGL